ncbi:hypothetical protein NQ318_009702 [Aromia moschata]|uniref:VPS9 domain-containing protein n=1 Tax=Aromia moschata TaxID=1265417 RepID=A0AAV8Y1G8_9CUCU|nr:hypothetical protein NQ318_009702 [Aromia moschata]
MFLMWGSDYVYYMFLGSLNSNPGAQNYLKLASPNKRILGDIKEIIYSWNYKSEYNLDAIKSDLDDIVSELTILHFENKNDTHLLKSLHCVVLNEIYENLIPLIRSTFSKDDLYFYERCQKLCKRNVRPGEFGSSIYNSVPFTAAIVELSVLDKYKSPLEKINCLCYTYDLIFADLKLALASLMSQYSEKEYEIPIINNEEVEPILMVVVIKSKLLYLPSNLFYIKIFGEHIIKENDNNRTILKAFERAVTKLIAVKENSIDPYDENKLAPHLDVCKTMKIMAFADKQKYENDDAKLREEEKKRLVSLITTSTAEKNFIPLNLPKMFS